MGELDITEERRFSVAFVGHVDHGKSTLIGRLLYDTGAVSPERLAEIGLTQEGEGAELAHLLDYLKEEREQGISIDTAQVFFQTATRDYVFIDAPGHREFIKNMMTGACEADAAMLLVDAAEGVGRQTWRHAFLLSLLGVQQCVVVINKMDLVGFEQKRFDALRKSLLELLARVGLSGATVIPASAKLGDNVAIPSDNMPWYDGPVVLEAIESLAVTETAQLPMRFSIQDTYDFDGQRIHPGRVESGVLRVGDMARVLPGGFYVTIESIRRFPADSSVAEAGTCVGVILSEDEKIRRGQVLGDPNDLPVSTDTFSAKLFWLAEEPLRKRDAFTVRVACQEGTCIVNRIHQRVDTATLDVVEEEADHLEANEVGEMDMIAQSPIILEKATRNPALGRIILERDGDVVGAGVVTGMDIEA